jgi:D-amino-acid dehydrogenase
MHVIVLGAGVVGVTTAYYLSQVGCEVTVIDRADDVCEGASGANGGQLSYSFTDALAGPRFIRKIPGLLFGQDPGSMLRLEPGLLSWGMRFLSQCTSKRARQNTIAVLKTAMRSAELLLQLREHTRFDFSHRPAGKLVLLSSNDELKAAAASRELKRKHGCHTEVLTHAQAMQVEPAIQHMTGDFLGAVHSQDDEVADARVFTVKLRRWLEKTAQVSFHMGADVTRLLLENGEVKAVGIGDETVTADAFVVSMGAWSGRLLRTVGVNPRIYPVRGYSVTLPPTDQSPSVSVTALKQRIVFSRINGFLRIAGFADFKGFDVTSDERRIAALLKVARAVAPAAADFDVEDTQQWGGFRPMTPDGQPCVGATSVPGLFVNTGHGMLGWTLACASGYDAAQAVARTH